MLDLMSCPSGIYKVNSDGKKKKLEEVNEGVNE